MTTTVFDLADKECVVVYDDSKVPEAGTVSALAQEWKTLDDRIRADKKRQSEIEKQIDAFADTAIPPASTPYPKTVIHLPTTKAGEDKWCVVYKNRRGFKYDSHKVQEMIKDGTLPTNLPFSMSMNERAYDKLPEGVRDKLTFARSGTFTRSLYAVVGVGEDVKAEDEE